MRKAIFKIMAWTLTMAVFLAFFNMGQAYAAAEGKLLQILPEGKDIVAYIECKSRAESAEAQVSQYPCGKTELIMPEEIAVHTVILVDNSLSVSEENRENMKNILRQYVQELPEQEAVSLAVFGEELKFLAEKSKDAGVMLPLIDGLEFQNQDTYLTDFLFQAVEQIEKDTEYTRFIVISDGVDNKSIGITKEELTAKLKETSRPIYAIGHVYKENSAELKNMFALSRLTGGREFLMEDYENVLMIAEEIHDFSDIYSVRAEIPEEAMDGENRHVLLKLHTEEGDMEVTGEVSMPFTLAEPEPVPADEPEAEPEPEFEPEAQPESEPEPEAQPEPELKPESLPEPVLGFLPAPEEKKPAGIGAEKIAGLAALIIAADVYILYKKRRKTVSAKETGKKKGISPILPANPVSAQSVPAASAPESGGDVTEILDSRYLLVLRDRANPERIFRYPMDSPVVVGRNIDLVQIPVDYNLTVSGRHCEFSMRNNRFFLRDLESVNHTFLDGIMIEEEREIVSGNVVRMGEVEFHVEIMPI